MSKKIMYALVAFIAFNDTVNAAGMNACPNDDRLVKTGCIGKREFPNGVTYEGGWLNDKFDGEGTYKLSNGTLYKGQWKNGLLEGEGEAKFPDGSSYKGSWHNNKFEGEGVFVASDKSKYIGSWKDNMRDGVGTSYDAKGKILSKAIWQKDKILK